MINIIGGVAMAQRKLVRHFGKMPRKAVFKKFQKYACIPEWMQTVEHDPFDYELRTPEEVKEEMRLTPPDFEVTIDMTYYPKEMEKNADGEGRVDNRNTRCKIWIDMRELYLAPLQRERFIYLLGPRYTGSDKVKIVCDMYPSYH